MRKQFIAALAASCASMALAAEPGWTVSESAGAVQILHAGVSKVATRGAGVAAGDTVTTGAGGRAVLVRGTEYMMVAANSRLRLPQAEASGGFTQMLQEFGNVVFMIKKKMTPHFEVTTPYLAAVVKGTTFSVGVNGDGASVQVLEGAVDVATGDGGAHELLRPGAVAMVGAGDLYRMHVEMDGVARTLVSPAAPASTIAPAPAQGAVTTAVATPAIAVRVDEAPVSLNKVTDGLVSGTIGGSADVTTATVAAQEASKSAVKTVEVATAALVAEDNNTKAANAYDKQSEAAAAAAKAKADADQAAADAAASAERSAAAAAAAAADKAKTDADAAESRATADQAQKDAADAAAAAAKAREDQVAQAAAQVFADAQAAAAAKAAQDAARDAADAAERLARDGPGPDGEADRAAQDAAKAAERAAKDADDAAQRAAKAADDAAKATADKLAKDAAEALKHGDADKAARDAAKAADDAAKAAAKAADDAAKDAAKAAEKAAAGAAAQLAKQQADAAKAAEKAARDAAKAADDAAKAAKKAQDDAAKLAANLLKGNPPVLLPPAPGPR